MRKSPRIVDHTPVLQAAKQDRGEIVGSFVLATLARWSTQSPLSCATSRYVQPRRLSGSSYAAQAANKWPSARS